MVQGNMGKFESHISLNACVLLRSENIVATSDPLLSLALLKDEQMSKCGGAC